MTKEEQNSKKCEDKAQGTRQEQPSSEIDAKDPDIDLSLSKSKLKPVQDGQMELEKKKLVDLVCTQKAEVIQSKDQFLRLAAEFDNYKKRQSQYSELKAKYANESIAKDLFSVLDSLEIALEHITDNKDSKNFKECAKGIRLVHQQFLDVLKQHHIEKMNTLGETFDPTRHEAVATLETCEREDNKVTAVFKAGYLLRDRIIRPAMVQVSKTKTDNVSKA